MPCSAWLGACHKIATVMMASMTFMTRIIFLTASITVLSTKLQMSLKTVVKAINGFNAINRLLLTDGGVTYVSGGIPIPCSLLLVWAARFSQLNGRNPL